MMPPQQQQQSSLPFETKLRPSVVKLSKLTEEEMSCHRTTSLATITSLASSSNNAGPKDGAKVAAAVMRQVRAIVLQAERLHESKAFERQQHHHHHSISMMKINPLRSPPS